jgi:hypothetical protein
VAVLCFLSVECVIISVENVMRGMRKMSVRNVVCGS